MKTIPGASRADIQPLETRWKGFRFRSRLEGRFAVFFSTLGLRFEYEPEGFDLGSAGRYLPDFYLPDVRWFAEVKPSTFLTAEEDKVAAFVAVTRKNLLMLDGPPGYHPYPGLVPADTGSGIVAEPHQWSLDIHRHRYAYLERRLWGDPDMAGATTEDLAIPLFSIKYQAAVNASRAERFGT